MRRNVPDALQLLATARGEPGAQRVVRVEVQRLRRTVAASGVYSCSLWHVQLLRLQLSVASLTVSMPTMAMLTVAIRIYPNPNPNPNPNPMATPSARGAPSSRQAPLPAAPRTWRTAGRPPNRCSQLWRYPRQSPRRHQAPHWRRQASRARAGRLSTRCGRTAHRLARRRMLRAWRASRLLSGTAPGRVRAAFSSVRRLTYELVQAPASLVHGSRVRRL